ncbi:MAG: TetR/AcrR family transcriptional regulator [Actinomycetes bacterium]
MSTSPAEVATPGTGAGDPAPTARGRRRREAIVDAATALFDQRGFHATSIDDIGAAAGISGPGLYRHFPSKDALLTAVFDRIWDRLRPAVDDAAGRPPAEALRTLLAAHVELALTDPGALRLLLRELRNVPDDYQRLAARNHRRWVDAWASPLRELHDDLDADRARALALAAHGAVDAATIRPADLPVEVRRVATIGAVERMLGL